MIYRPSWQKLHLPKAPESYSDTEYDIDYEPQPTQAQQSSDLQKRPEPVMHIKQDKKPSEIKSKLAAKAVVYELEREAQQLKNAEKVMNDLKVYNTEKTVYDTEKELLRETKILEDAQKQMNAMNTASRKAQAELQLRKEASNIKNAQKQIDAMNAAAKKAKAEMQLSKEAKELMKVQKQIDDIKKIKEIEKESKTLKKAEKQVKEIQFLNQQEKIVKQARDIAKAQKEIDSMNKNTKKSIIKQTSKPIVKEVAKVKTVKSSGESFYFATENGNKFHEPGCLSIKKVPKNKLILYTSKKDAMKKGLQPCSVCIPK